MRRIPVRVIDVPESENLIYLDRFRVFRLEEYLCELCGRLYYDVYYKTRLGHVGVGRSEMDGAGRLVEPSAHCREHSPGRRTRRRSE